MLNLHPKHQKLILQCYPPGKATDKKPNPLELLYLLYYASTRRVKLDKVVVFLEHKTRQDAKAGRVGNLHVTCALVLALIDKCSENLNSFAQKVIVILGTINALGDLPLCRSVVATYAVLCARLDGALFSGDQGFVDAFSAFSASLIKTGQLQLVAQKPSAGEWRLLALQALRHVFGCLGYNTQLLTHFISMCVPLLAAAVHDARPVLQRHVSVSLERRMSHSELEHEALLGLKTLFNTLLLSQISAATRAIVDVEKRDPEWLAAFLQMCALWIPVQLRFVALLVLSSLSLKKNTAEESIRYARLTLALVLLNLNMIGLSITDVLQQFLALLGRVHLELAEEYSSEEVQVLSELHEQCVCSLASHIYYIDQVPDAVGLILVHIDSVALGAPGAPTARTHALILVLLDTVGNILRLLPTKPATIARNHATLDTWDQLWLLMDLAGPYAHLAAALTPPQRRALHDKYVEVFAQFCSGELKPLRAANANRWIENPDNVLAHFCAFADRCLQAPQPVYVVQGLWKVLQLVLAATGVNFVHSFLPFFWRWQALAPADAVAKTRDTFAYLVLRALVEELAAQYPQLEQHPELAHAVNYDVQLRKALGAWVLEVDGSKQPALSSSLHFDNKVTPEVLAALSPEWMQLHRREEEKRGLGLGTSNDISLIHLGLGRADTALNGSYSLYLFRLAPRVADLKHSMGGSIPRVLKAPHTSVGTIVDSLGDDDREIVV